MSEEEKKAEQRKKLFAMARKAGVREEDLNLLGMASDSAEAAAKEEFNPSSPPEKPLSKLDRELLLEKLKAEAAAKEEFNPSSPPKLGLGTQGSGVRSTQGALGPVPKLGLGTKNTRAAGKNVGDGVTQTSSSQYTFAPRDKDRQKFFNKPVVRSSSSSKLQVGKLGATKNVYSPRRGLRRAMRTADVVRKRGYGDVASDIVRGGVGLSGTRATTRSTAMKKAMEAQDREAQIIAAANAAEARRKVREQFKGA